MNRPSITLAVSPELALLIVSCFGPMNGPQAAERVTTRAREFSTWSGFKADEHIVGRVMQDAYDACHDFLKHTSQYDKRDEIKHRSILDANPNTPKEDLILLT